MPAVCALREGGQFSASQTSRIGIEKGTFAGLGGGVDVGSHSSGDLCHIAVAAMVVARPCIANPGCSLSDIGQAAKDTWNNAPASCASQADDPAFYALLIYLAAALQTPQGVAFCDGVESVDASISGAEKQLASYWDKLSADQQSALSNIVPAFGDASSSASDVAGALNLVSCGCKTARWKGPDELASDFGACASDALCAAADWLHKHVSSDFSECTGPPPNPPQLIDCRVDPCANGLHDCDLNVSVAGQEVNCNAGDKGYVCQRQLLFFGTLFKSGQGNYCYCPPEMQHADGFYKDVYEGISALAT